MPKNNYATKLLTVIASYQNSDGSFSSFFMNSTHVKTTPTIFMTALVCSLMIEIDHQTGEGDEKDIIQQVIQKSLRFLYQNLSPQGTFNYLPADSPYLQTYQYPDDFDDTALALLCITTQKSKETPKLTAQTVMNLIHSESKPGGPYGTWIGNTDDVDPLVNVQIARLLEQQSVELPNLTDYICGNFAQDTYHSQYYVSKISTLFMAHFIQNVSVRKATTKEIKRCLETNRLSKMSILDTIMLHICCQKLEIENKKLHHLYKKTIDSIKNGSIDMHKPLPFYYGLPLESRRTQAGSPALLSALLLYADCVDKSTSQVKSLQAHKITQFYFQKKVLTLVDDLPMTSKKTVQTYMTKLYAQHPDSIAHPRFPLHFAQSLRRVPSSKDIYHGTLAYLLGWISYSILDDILDESLDATHIPTALYLMTQLSDQLGLIGKAGVSSHYLDLFKKMHLSLCVQQQTPPHSLSQLRDVAQYKSILLMSVPLSLYKAGGNNESQLTLLEDVFHSLLLSRHLLDDLYDYWQDSSLDQPTLIQYIQNYFKSHLPNIVESELFWLKTCPNIVSIVKRKIDDIDGSISKIDDILADSPFMKVISHIRRKANDVTKESAHIQTFVDTLTFSSSGAS